MVASSKLYEAPMCYLKCTQVLAHPGLGCIENIFWMAYKYHLHSGKYFLPLLISQIAFQMKSLNRESVKNAFKFYGQLAVTTAISSSLVYFLICCFRHLCGKFTKYTTVFLPSYLGTQLCWVFPSSVVKSQFLVLQQANLETFLRKYSNPLSDLIINSKLTQTIIFMLTSGIIMHYKSAKVYNGFWFIQPNERKPTIDDQQQSQNSSNKSDDTVCVHANKTCLSYCFDGIKKCIPFGVILDIYGTFMRARVKDVKGFRQISRAYLNAFRPNMIGFFVSYVGIYRISSCILAQKFGHLSVNKQNIIAAMLGGMSHVFLDKITFLTLSIVMTIQIMCQKISTSETENKFVNYLNRIPFTKILYPFLIGQMVHDFLFHNDKVSKIAQDAIGALSAGRAIKSVKFLKKHTIAEIMDFKHEYCPK